jgi:glutamate-1-semialdehyde 2,1-aminomutase
VKEAVLKAVENGTSYGAPTEKEIQLAELIVEMVPSVEMARLVNSGTEATMTAIRLARAYTRRDKIIKIEGCYHGHGDSFLIKAGSGALTLGEPNSPGVTKAVSQDTLIAPYNDAQAIKQLYEAYPEQIAALILEPVPANMGVILPEDGYLQQIRDITTKYNSLLVFDEVITGFRIRKGGAQEYYGVLPDLTTLGKIIGGGFPIGCYGGKQEIMSMMSPVGPVYQAGTLSGNPVAVSAGIATLQTILTENVVEKVNAKAQAFFEEVGTIAASASGDLFANSFGSMATLFFQAGPVKNFQDAVRSDTERFIEFFGKMLDQGIYLAPSQFEAMFLSQAHSDADLEETLQALKAALCG